MALKLYVGAVAIAATVLGVLAAALTHSVHGPGPGFLLFFAALIVLAELLQVRYYHRRQIDAFNLMEGVIAPLMFFGSPEQLAIVVTVGMLAAGLLGRNPPLKTAFNTAQWLAAAMAGSLAFHLAAPADLSTAGAMGALALGILTVSLVNLALITVVLALVDAGGDRHSDEVGLRGVLAGHLYGHLGSLTAGVALTAAYRWSDWALFIAVVLVVGMHVTGRANAAVQADQKRLRGLHAATHALATSLESRQALPRFLAATREGFEVAAVELVLFTDTTPVVHVCDERGTHSHRPSRHELADLLRDRSSEPTRLSLPTDDPVLGRALAGTGHHRVLVAPLATANTTSGLLLLFDRRGMEGFEDGELTIAGALARDLVEFFERVELMREIDEERGKLTDIVESTSDGILTIAADGTVTSWNRGFATMTGYSADEMIGTRHFGLLRTRDTAGRDIILERWHEGEVGIDELPTELQIVAAAGQTVWLSCSYSRIPGADDRGDVLVVVARNVTQTRELEKLKDDFVAVVSHELRTPLVPIKGWAQTLLTRGERLTDDQRRTAVQSILAQAQKLESLVLNILEASRVESGRLDADGIADVAAIALRVADETLSARPERTLRVHPPAVPCNVRGSAVWVERAVSNLVANAVKYSPDDEPVDVVVSVEDDQVRVAVTDRGPGIALDAQERIFERFERLEETMKQTGTGLGLYITRRLARAMGGDVTVSSVPGAGSTFLLRLPLAPVTRLPEQRTGAPLRAIRDPAAAPAMVRLR